MEEGTTHQGVAGVGSRSCLGLLRLPSSQEFQGVKAWRKEFGQRQRDLPSALGERCPVSSWVLSFELRSLPWKVNNSKSKLAFSRVLIHTCHCSEYLLHCSGTQSKTHEGAGTLVGNFYRRFWERERVNWLRLAKFKLG